MSTTSFTDAEMHAIREKNSLPRFAFVPLGLFGLYMIDHPWPTEHWTCQAPWIVLTGWIFFCLASVLHETAHHTLSGFKALDTWFGRLLGTVMLVPYSAYREAHIRHHAYLNKPKDFELWPYSDPNASLAFRRFFVWVDLLLAPIGAAIIYGRTYFSRKSPITSPSLRNTIAAEYLFLVFFWATTLFIVARSDEWARFTTMWLLPYTFAASFQAIRKLTEHLGMVSYDPLDGTRTVIGRNWFTKICTYFNFDIFVHGPHHRHPKMPHTKLKHKMQQYHADHPEVSYPTYSRYWEATLAMLPSLWKNPGVGVNCGAPHPELEKQPDLDNFVSDVQTEVLDPAASDDQELRPAA